MTESFHPMDRLTAPPEVRKGKARMKTPQKVLIVQTQAENAGAQEIARHLGDGLEQRGYDVHQLFFYRKTDAFDAVPNTSFCVNDRPRSLVAFATFLFRLVKQIRDLKPDVVLTFQHYGNLFGAPAARLAGVRHVVANQVSAQATMNDTIRRIDKLFGSIGMYDTITVNSADTAGEYADFPARYTKKIVYVPHGFKDKSSALSKEQAREKFGLPQTVTLLGSVARLNALKRLDVAIRALAHDDSWHLVLGGQGPEEENLRQLAADLGVADRVYFTGEMESHEVGDLLAAMDLFVFPSEAETFGLAAVEAAQAGLPLVSNGIPVLREVLKTDLGPCSLFADSDNPDSFIAPIRTLLSDADQTAAMIKSSKELKTLYSMDAMIDRYEQILTDKKSNALPMKGHPAS